MNTASSVQLTTPVHLVEALAKKPLNKGELMTYLAHLQVYTEYHVEQAKDSNVNAAHPYHSDEGKAALYAEISAIQTVFQATVVDLQGGRIKLQGSEMRQIGDLVGMAHFTFEKAFATYQMPFRG
jgi:hypothetical protein